MQENSIVISSQDAKRLGLKTGDLVKVVSATNPEGIWDLKNGKKKPMTRKVLVTEGTRPGVISFALGFGHWATGAADFQIDGKKIKGDASRAKGIHANAAMWTDPSLRKQYVSDRSGGRKRIVLRYESEAGQGMTSPFIHESRIGGCVTIVGF